MTDTVKVKNYTDEMVDEIVQQYTANPTRETVDSLAAEFGKTPRSIIAKLSTLNLYVAQPRTTKRGEPIVKKEVFVAQIQNAIGRELPSLGKMTKADLEAMVEALVG